MHTKTNLYEAHFQWATRPPDQRFPDINALYNFTSTRRKASSDRYASLHDLHVVLSGEQGLEVNSGIPKSRLTHWSFGQVCSLTRSPSSYLRRLPTELVRDCLQHSLQKSSANCKLLLTDDTRGTDSRMLTAITGPEYGRIWDADVVENLMKAIDGTSWHLPPGRTAFGSDSSGLYASDRDMFAFLVNDEQPIEVGNARLGRGFFLWNSEVGSATFGLTTFLYNYVCGNHIVWDAEKVEELRIVHRKWAPGRFSEQALPILNRFAESRTDKQRIVDTVSEAMKTHIGSSANEAWESLKDRNFTRTEVAQAWKTAQAEGEQPGTLWGLLQGFTAEARQRAYAGSRVEQERKAGQLLNLVNN